MDADSVLRRSGLRLRIALVATLVVGGALAIGGVALVTLLQTRLEDAARSAATLRARDVAALATSDALPAVLALPGEEDAFVQVVATDGRVLAASENIDGEPAFTDLVPSLGQQLRWTGALSAIDPQEPMSITALGIDTGTDRATVYAGESLERAEEAVGAIRTLLILAIPVIALIAGTVTWWAVRRALRPVDSIRRTMSDITATDLHRRVPEWSARDEIGELAATVNSTLARLESSTEDQRRFVADASHELRGPLAALRADLEISVTHPDRTEWTEIAPELLRDVERLQELTDDLLFLALLDARRSPERGAVDLGPLVTEALESIRRPELRTRFDLATEHVTVVGDRRQLRRAISNLVANAERHARSTVAATLRAADGAVVLTIADDGAGIPAEDRERVFERFVRLDPARTRDDGGTGLGLAIVRDIVQLHGGEVSIGEHQPTGAIVTVHLPLAVASGYGRRRGAQ